MSFGIISHACSIIEQISSNHFERKKCQLFGNFNDSRDEAKGSLLDLRKKLLPTLPKSIYILSLNTTTHFLSSSFLLHEDVSLFSFQFEILQYFHVMSKNCGIVCKNNCSNLTLSNFIDGSCCQSNARFWFCAPSWSES